MRPKARLLAPLILAALPAFAPALTQAQEATGPKPPCGGDFGAWVDGVKAEATALGHAPETVDAFFSGIRTDPAVLKADRAQGVFQRDFVDFSRRLISENRIANGRANAERYDATFDRIEAEYGVPRGVLLAFWAFETDYGAVQGDFNTADALATLAHDCRRPELFRPQLIAAIELYAKGGLDPASTTGAWAGEIGQVQMLPEDILVNGVDGDGDGRVDLKNSPRDALLSGGKMLAHLGWRANEPWLQEIVVPEGLDWSQTGLDTQKPVSEWQALGIAGRSGDLGRADLPASVLLPMGKDGPAFLAYPNFRVYFEWNQSLVYVTTAAYFANRLSGAPVYDAGNAAPGLSGNEMVRLQEKLQARGYDVGGADGILGEMTRQAVQAEQQRLGMPADAWPTPALLGAL
ncbi:lytic murein transglycosylase [Limimaricola hongkongensis]|uniref:Membrane-bound lytic murein transglycosylase B n=1 Tax=Limimaricola hongkongensis DSM 17492 TaxID=1122180 RepID=A0A017HHW3_9RHOB|nr:lytic murein transglycosylase [Limimaricola hongkongensis]EYD73384.1 Membrane-bound lytic murein transglycosylase B [Limimaricola hongkongensis DSM 17492]